MVTSLQNKNRQSWKKLDLRALRCCSLLLARPARTFGSRNICTNWESRLPAVWEDSLTFIQAALIAHRNGYARWVSSGFIVFIRSQDECGEDILSVMQFSSLA